MERLGYERFGAQGGDWGASISNHLGLRHPDRIAGIHLNMMSAGPLPGKQDFTDEEQALIVELRARSEHHLTGSAATCTSSARVRRRWATG